jgi:predicted DNA-binding protein
MVRNGVDDIITVSYVIDMKEQLKQTALRIPPKLKARLDSYCEENEMKMTPVILEALRQYLDKQG